MSGIVRVARQILESSSETSTLRGIEKLTAKDVLDAFKDGDVLAGKIMEQVGDKLGGALAFIAAVVDPEAIEHAI